jgi:hypothetical protein
MDVQKYTIRDDYDPDADYLTADTSPLSAYLRYLQDVRSAGVGIGFSYKDFETHNLELRRRRSMKPKRVSSLSERLFAYRVPRH